MRKLKILLPFLIITQCLFSQVTNTGLMDTLGGEKIKNVTIGGYLDTYYSESGAGQVSNIGPFAAREEPV